MPCRENRWAREYMNSRKRVSSTAAICRSIRLSMSTRRAWAPSTACSRSCTHSSMWISTGERYMTSTDGVGERPAQAAEHPPQLGGVFLQGGDDAGLTMLGSAVDEVQPHDRLARAGGSRDHRGRTRPHPAAQHLIQRGDAGGDPVIAERVAA